MKPQKQPNPGESLAAEAALDDKTLDDLELSADGAEGVTGGKPDVSDLPFIKK